MKRNLLIAILFIFSSFTVAEVNGQEIDHTFTYQGELIDAGKPANDDYDITIQGYDSLAGGASSGSLSTHIAVTVENGLFTLDDVDLGAATFDGKELWLEVSVRKTSDGGSYTALSPRQSLKAVPYAKTLTKGGASAGQVLTFDGSQWAPASPGSSPWANNGSDIFYATGYVGIGVTPSDPLYVNSSRTRLATFDGGNQMYMMFKENGESRGYVGSFQNPATTPGINDEDFEIGTTSESTGNMHIVTGANEPRITVTAGGNVGINSLDPRAKLFVQGTSTDGDLFRVKADDTTIFYVDDNGGASIGSWTTPPVNGLRIEGGLQVEGLSKTRGGLVVGDTVSGAPADGLTVKGGATIGYTLVNPPTRGMLVRGGVMIGPNPVAPPTDGLLVRGKTSLRGQLSLTPANNDAALADGTGYFVIGSESGKNIVFDSNEIMARNNAATSGLFLQQDGGDVYVGGSLVHSSDRRLKGDITELPYGLAEILLLEPKAYHWKNRDQKHKSFGLIAQEVQPVIKEIVHTR